MRRVGTPRSTLRSLPDRLYLSHTPRKYPGARSLAEWAVAERHLGPRLARAGREGRAQGHNQGSKRPPGQDPDRAIYLPFYLSAGSAAEARLSSHATSSHPNPTCAEPPGAPITTLVLYSWVAPFPFWHLSPLHTHYHIMYQEEKKDLEQEEKREKVIVPALRLMQ